MFMSLVTTWRSARRRMIQTGAVIRRRVVAHGRVQGVFFRDTCRRQAWTRQVSGWVANREDGAVEAVFEGEPSDVQAMVDWARQGPYQAHVTKLEVIEEDAARRAGFLGPRILSSELTRLQRTDGSQVIMRVGVTMTSTRWSQACTGIVFQHLVVIEQ